MSTYQERKAARRDYYERFVEGWRLEKCVACNGSGRYDAKGSPPCGGCDGTGKTRVAPPKPAQEPTP